MSKGVFARHETFHPRYGWLKKGFDAAKHDPGVFLRRDAHVILGVGKNMARAIRYWCHAFKVLDEVSEEGLKKRESHPTGFGELLLDDAGFDPYLEDLGSLWLLHWGLLKDPSSVTAWQYAFFVHARPEFSAAELTASLAEHVRLHFPQSRTAESSLRKDASCILRMYGQSPLGGAVNEESIQCPFAELGLLRRQADQKRFRFKVGPKPGLSDYLITAASLDFAATLGSGASTIALGRLLRDAGSPGLAFRLAEGDLYTALERRVRQEQDLGLADAGGIIQLAFSTPPEELAERLIAQHYRASHGQRAIA